MDNNDNNNNIDNIGDNEINDQVSATSTDECNVEEYLRIIRADRYFHVTEIPSNNIEIPNKNTQSSNNGDNSVDSITKQNEVTEKNSNFNSTQKNLSNNNFDNRYPGLLKINCGCSQKFSYKITVKDPSNLIIGNFLTPLGIRYIDVKSIENNENIEKDDINENKLNTINLISPDKNQKIENIIDPKIDNKIDKNLDKKVEHQLSSSTQIAWSIGTKNLNISAFGRENHFYNAESTNNENEDEIYNDRNSKSFQVR